MSVVSVESSTEYQVVKLDHVSRGHYENKLESFLKLEDYQLDNVTLRDLKTASLSSRKKQKTHYVALDCEFVGVGHSKKSDLARISIVNYYGHVLLDEYVSPVRQVTQWRTFVSGIRPHNLRNAPTKHEIMPRIKKILGDKIIVGHALKSDFTVMGWTPYITPIDTALHENFQVFMGRKSISLKKLTKELLGLTIQDGEHSSVEDARAAMLLFRLNRRYFDN